MTREEFEKKQAHLDKIFTIQDSLSNKCKEYPNFISQHRNKSIGLIPMLEDNLNQAYRDAGFNNIVSIISRINFNKKDSNEETA